jgi:hypothetical protein
MTKTMTVKLGDPLLVFIWSVGLLLLGCAIGMHWHASSSTAVAIAFAGSLLVVIEQMVTVVLCCFVTAAWLRRQRCDERHNGNV